MIKIKNEEVIGWEHAIRGMRNPMNSWSKSDSGYCGEIDCGKCKGIEGGCDNEIDHNYNIGDNDLSLMKKLAKAGTDHRKFMRMLVCYLDIISSQFWWSEFDTYKVGTVRNSCSKMHRIHINEFIADDFSHEGINEVGGIAKQQFVDTINVLEWLRLKFNETGEKKYWRAIIELLPSGYNMRATVMLNYEVLSNIYKSRKNHKLDEWHTFCDWIETLPYSEIITDCYKEKDK